MGDTVNPRIRLVEMKALGPFSWWWTRYDTVAFADYFGSSPSDLAAAKARLQKLIDAETERREQTALLPEPPIPEVVKTKWQP